MKVSIIIPTCDRGAVFDQTLRAAAAAVKGMNAEIIVVNDSKTSTPKIAEALPAARLFQNPGRGVAAARNYGARHASGDLLLFVDDDILITQESLRHVIDVHRENSGIALNPDWTYPPELMHTLSHTSFGRFLQAYKMTTFRGWYADKTWKDNALFESLSVASFHLSMARSDFEKSGGYDEQFPFAGFEDYDFPLRLKNTGIQFRIDTRICVFHNELDRTELSGWLNGNERRAFTRAVAVHRGYQHLALHYSQTKQFALRLALVLYPVLFWLFSQIPNRQSFDGMAFKWIGYLQAAKIFRGYINGLSK